MTAHSDSYSFEVMVERPLSIMFRRAGWSWQSRALAMLALPMLLAGCRHKAAPAAKTVSSSLPAAKATQPAVQADPLAALRPRLADAFSKVRTAAGPLGLLGWPGVAAPDGSDESNPSLEDRFFHNDRALVFVDKANGTYSALVLMPESKSTDELHYWPVWVSDLFGSPKLERANFENPDRNKFDGTDGLWRASGDSTQPEASRTADEVRLYAKEPFELVAGTRDSDAPVSYLANATPTFLDLVEGITDTQGLIEGFPADEQPDMDLTLPRKDLQSATKLGETARFVWFTTNGKNYAARKADWDTWMKWPQSPDTKTP